MIRRLFLFVLVLQGPFYAARAADIAQISCPVSRLAPATRAALASLAAGLGSYEDPAMIAFEGVVATCASELGWSDDEREAARKFGLSSLGHEELRRTLARDGVDVASLEQAIVSDRELARAMRSPAFSQNDVQRFLRRNLAAITRAAGPHAANQTVMERVGVFLAMRAVLEAERHRFVAQ